ncbi:O-acyltransferase like protein-like [Bolinopsis microptera]|uniref:O-acyltransferase like protein-like n=1 Tax=Bolinopsis microptera TaxID=2820187 RepID=UPI0030790C90
MYDGKQEFDAAVTIVSLLGILVVVGTLWYNLEPIIIRFLEQDDTTVLLLVDAEEHPHKDVDKQVPSTEVKEETSNQREWLPGMLAKEQYETSNQPEWLPGRLAKCFALQRTIETLFTTTTKPGQVLCLNGIRVLSINRVVLGHAYSALFIGGYSYITELVKRRNFIVVYNVIPSDSFFALSGFLVTYLLLKQLAKRGGLTPLQWIAFYVHRYVRLTVPYLVALLIEGWRYRFLMTGPRAQQTQTTDMGSHKMCEEYWYTNVLYINNLVPWKAAATCLGQGWYLANNMQFFLIAPLFVVLLFGTPLLGVLATGGTMICSAVSAAVITTAGSNLDEMWLQYNKPWIRITPYLVGILGGWFYWKWGKQISDGVKTLPEWQKVMCATPIWAVTAAVEYAVVFGLCDDAQNMQKGNPDEAESVFYQSLARIAWSLSLTIQILLCQCGLGGFINSFLSWSGWQILSRLTYSVFLLHLGLITALFGQMKHTLFLNSDFEFAVLYLGTLAMSYLSAALLYLAVEQPVANLEGITYRKSI